MESRCLQNIKIQGLLKKKKNLYTDADSKFTQSEKEWASGRLVRSTASPHCLFHVDSCVYTGTITTVFNL